MLFFCLSNNFHFFVEIGSIVTTSHHEVSEFVDGEDDGIIMNQIRAGISDKDGDVLRYEGLN